ncbi:MAG: polyprenyl synthetase family protein [Pseudomonadota bacterium]
MTSPTERSAAEIIVDDMMLGDASGLFDQATDTARVAAKIASSQLAQEQLAEVETLMRDLATGFSVLPTTAAKAVTAHFEAGGKRIRALMALDAGHKLGLGMLDAQAIAACCELLHNASLVHDDIQDADETRRDKPSLWAQFGTDHAICAGDLMLSASYAALAGTSDKQLTAQLIQRTHRAVTRTVNGQTADIEQRGQTLDDISVYEAVAAEKSGPLLGLPIELSLVMAGRPDEVEVLNRAVRSIAIAYQLVDDLGDVEEDAAQGTLNGVWVLARQADSSEVVAVKEAATLVRQHLTYARQQAAMLYGDCGAVLADLADKLDAKLSALLSHAT